MATEFISVVVVDDNRDAADSMAIALRLMGFETKVAYGGLDGLVAASQMEPDVIVLDLNMPGMDGLDAAAHLRLMPSHPRLIAMTADSSEATRRRTHALGFLAHLTKPVDPQVLADEIRKATGKR